MNSKEAMEMKREVKTERVASETNSLDKVNAGMKVESFESERDAEEREKKSFDRGAPEEKGSSYSGPTPELPGSSSRTSMLSSTNPDSSVDVAFHIKDEVDPVYVCDDCGLMVDGEEELKEHVVSSHLPMTSKLLKCESSEDGHSNAICESCGQPFASLELFEKHFKAEHFVVEETRVEEKLEIPDSVSEALRGKIERLVELMAVQRRDRPELLLNRPEFWRRVSLKKALTDPMKTRLSDVGALIKREFPVGLLRSRNDDRRRVISYLAFHLRCGTHQLIPYVNGRWNNPLPINPVDIQAMKERLKQQVASVMPDVITKHNSKAKRLSDRKFAPVKTFTWTVSLKQSFKDLVNMHLKNFRFDVDVRRDADENELKSGVEEHLKRFLKTLVGVWPAGWMTERILMSECRSLIREFLQTLTKLQESESDAVVADVDEDSTEFEPPVLVGDLADDDSTSRRPRVKDDEADLGLTSNDRNKIVWTKRVIRLIRLNGSEKRMYLMPKDFTMEAAGLSEDGSSRSKRLKISQEAQDRSEKLRLHRSLHPLV